MTDDYVVSALFGDGGWEALMQRVQGKDEADKMVDVQLDQESYRELISVMS